MINRRRCTCWGVSCGGVFTLLASNTVFESFVESSSVGIAAVARVVMEAFQVVVALFVYVQQERALQWQARHVLAGHPSRSPQDRHTTKAMENPVASSC